MSTKQAEFQQIIKEYILNQSITGFRVCTQPSETSSEVYPKASLLVELSSGFAVDFPCVIHGFDLDYSSLEVRAFQGENLSHNVWFQDGYDATDDKEFIETFEIVYHSDASTSIQDISFLVGQQITQVKVSGCDVILLTNDGYAIFYNGGYPCSDIWIYDSNKSLLFQMKSN